MLWEGFGRPKSGDGMLGSKSGYYLSAPASGAVVHGTRAAKVFAGRSVSHDVGQFGFEQGENNLKGPLKSSMGLLGVV